MDEKTSKSGIKNTMLLLEVIFIPSNKYIVRKVKKILKSKHNWIIGWYILYVCILISMALPVMEFQDQGYKIKKVFA